MVLVPAQSGAVQVTTASYGAWTTIDIPQDITIGQNGTLIVYISNGQHRVVGFDNLNVSYYKGRLLDEQHYYPFGLTMKGASASASPLVNRYLYQGKEMQDEAGLQLYDFHARQYDPQTGRFWGIDPMDQFPSGYTGMGNDPANGIDPDGMQVKSNSTNASVGVSAEAGGSIGGNDEISGEADFDLWVRVCSLHDQLIGANSMSAGQGAGKIPSTYDMFYVARNCGIASLPSFVVDQMNSQTNGSQARSTNSANYYNGQEECTTLPSVRVNGNPAICSSDASITAGPINNESANDLWNSPAARFLVPDIVHMGVSFTGIGGVGVGEGFELNWIVRGPKASLKPIPSTTEEVGVGFNMGATLNFGGTNYTGPVKDINKDMISTNSARGDIPNFWVSPAFAFGAKAGATFSASYLGRGKGFMIGREINLGVGLPIGDIPVNMSGGVSNTYILPFWGGK